MPATAQTAQPRQMALSDQGRQVLSLNSMIDQGEDHDVDSLGATLASILSSDLLRGKKAVAIRHNGSTYRLQATRLGKLILTK